MLIITQMLNLKASTKICSISVIDVKGEVLNSANNNLSVTFLLLAYIDFQKLTPSVAQVLRTKKDKPLFCSLSAYRAVRSN